ncbi:class I SAM-dependent methyltransferase [Streptomyces iconiensis]|uniref:Class I SAM-dependent methyltransferase n=1 Tax=Streptomyces iconiensis TaxID=1384038 RepID=A0ABT7A477_9ACTN|nr:class I SAM-dependent methyltransferase [Streptomyces iconiensis]MDJ1136147.1 class I SAM-dependent methyltransferase [Streptomyces iconiensis]
MDATEAQSPTDPPDPGASKDPVTPVAPADANRSKDLVRRGYDQLGAVYDDSFGSPTKYGPWLADLLGKLARADGGACRVLDLGCGSGVPVARDLSAAGHHVTGVDISATQVRRAQQLVPEAEFRCADVTRLDFPAASFDAVVTLYALIHIPVAEQPALLERIADWLRPGGHLLATTGTTAYTGTDPNWLDSGVPMWWSHADAATYRTWLTSAGLTVDHEEFVPEGGGGHTLFRAHRAPGTHPSPSTLNAPGTHRAR